MSERTLPKRERVLYFDWLRVIAIFAVVFLHVAAQKWYQADINSAAWNVFNIYDSAVRWCVPVMLMISGALFLDEHVECDLKRLYSRTILRMITAFAFWSFFYAVDKWYSGKASIKVVISAFFEGHFHMWFIFMIVGIYVLVPVIRMIVRSKQIEKYALIIGFVFSFLLPRSISFLKIIPRLEGMLFLLTSASNMLTDLNFRMLSYYVYYFILGHYIHNYWHLSERKCIRVYITGMIGFISTAWLTCWYSKCTGSANTWFYSNVSCGVLIMAVAVFVFGKHKLSCIQYNTSFLKMLVHLSKCSFGIYLVHVWIRDKLDTVFMWNALSFMPIVNVPLLSIVIFALSYLVSALLNRIPNLNRYIVRA